MNRVVICTGVLAAMTGLAAGPAWAENLQAAPDAPFWLHWGAAALLWAHIGGGTLGLLSGTVAILTRKGRTIHRAAGKVFFVAMFVTYAIGAGVAPFLTEGQRPNFVAGILALYLLITAFLAARRRDPKVGWIEYGGLATALAIVAAGGLFMWQGANDPSGTVDGSPPQAFALFIVAGLFAAAGEIHVIIRRSIAGVSRISRHLWRMCMSLFIASGSFFLGQQQILPPAMVGTFWQYAPMVFPLLAILIWLVVEHLPKKPVPAP
ncbi:hypothetical protein [Asticcacaulis sp. AC402]|uniref:hypothetical protein n=1 Tax=Asticcacaulis sp. AC402 TaxID=1282361 RepID=UPI0003C3E518|nr:hypothetical protein [Asticcacaulis sp. AC402]ESQ74969.1 hypothetical protein ABAC402_11235 [Asticcacaulis sp. AC402]